MLELCAKGMSAHGGRKDSGAQGGSRKAAVVTQPKGRCPGGPRPFSVPLLPPAPPGL